jgi:hypothetical protein
MEGGPMMWMSFVMDGNRQKGKWLIIKPNALKWTKANNAPPKGSPWRVPMVDGMTMTLPSGCGDYKTRWFKCIKCTNKGYKLYDVPTCCTKFLKYDLSWH